MKNLLLLLFILIYSSSYCQVKVDSITSIPKEDFERPFNFFGAAGVSYRFGSNYDVTISPIDYNVRFEEVGPIMTRFSVGLVWNPLPDQSEENLEKYKRFIKSKGLAELYEDGYKAARKHLAIALLVNVVQLSFSSGNVNTTSPIDVGFGVGIRNQNFLILGTVEFTPMRTPREYFINEYKGNNRQLILYGAEEPSRAISYEDNSIFISKIFPSIGLKMAYTFSKTP